MAAFIDRNGATQQVSLDVGLYKEFAEKGMTFQAGINQMFPTDASKYGSTFEQLCASEGIFVKGNRQLGIRPSTLADVLEGRPSRDANVNTRDGVPASRILYPAVVLAAVEDKLAEDMMTTQNALNDMIGQDVTINGDKYEWPVLNYDNAEKARGQRVAQLAMPVSMLQITVSDTSRRLSGVSIGMEVSDQALNNTPLDFVALTISRQAAIERNEKAVNDLLAVWNGDVDTGDASLSSKGLVKRANQYDTSISSAGALTQKAWIKFLSEGSVRRTTSHIVTDIDTALIIESRTGKPIITNDDPNSRRIDNLFEVMNPTWPGTNVKLFLVPEGTSWAANTIMALDKRYSLRRVQSLTIAYNAIESYVMRRSTAMRFDYGVEVHRLFDDATVGMTLTTS